MYIELHEYVISDLIFTFAMQATLHGCTNENKHGEKVDWKLQEGRGEYILVMLLNVMFPQLLFFLIFGFFYILCKLTFLCINSFAEQMILCITN